MKILSIIFMLLFLSTCCWGEERFTEIKRQGFYDGLTIAVLTDTQTGEEYLFSKNKYGWNYCEKLTREDEELYNAKYDKKGNQIWRGGLYDENNKYVGKYNGDE